jgi:hypothetical protein
LNGNGVGPISEVEQLRLDTVKELRDMKDSIKEMNKANLEMIGELK